MYIYFKATLFMKDNNRKLLIWFDEFVRKILKSVNLSRKISNVKRIEHMIFEVHEFRDTY